MKKAVLIAAPHGLATHGVAFRGLDQADLTPIFPPLTGAVALGSYLAVHGVPVEIVDVQMDYGIGLTPDAERLVLRRVTQDLLAQKDAIAWVGISQISVANSGMELAAEIRRVLPRVPVIMGGYFASFAYRQVLEECPAVTAVVRGDGEAAALRISQRVDRGQPFLVDDTPNLAWRERGRIATSRVEPMDLGGLPICDFRLLRHPGAYPTISVYTSRGCPWACRFCAEARMRPYAAFPAAWVSRQLSHIASVTSCRRILFADPTFGLGQERTREVCRVLRGQPFTYAAGTRADVVDAGSVRLLRQAGFDSLYYGVESASLSTLVRMNKVESLAAARRYVEKAAKAVRACFEEGVTPFVGLMVAFPGDSEADCRATMGFVKRLRRLHDRVKPRGGKRAGLIVDCYRTGIIDGTSISRTHRRTEMVPGGRILSLSPRMADIARRAIDEFRKQSVLTPLALERVNRYWMVSLPMLLEKHPELKDDQGVLAVGDALSRGAPRLSLQRASRIMSRQGSDVGDSVGIARAAGSQALSARDIGALGETLTKNRDQEARREAARALAAQGSKAAPALPALLAALDDPDWETRREAQRAISLVELRDAPCRPSLINALKTAGACGRCFAAGALRRMEPSAATVSALGGALRDEDKHVRRMASLALGEMGSAACAAAGALAKALRDDPDSQSRQNIALAFSKMDRPPAEAAEALVRALGDEDLQVRYEAAYALSKMESVPDSAAPSLLKALETEDERLRWAVARALGRLAQPSKKVFDALSRLTSDLNQDISREAGSLLMGLRGSRAEA
ncbi:MAG: HEAT repeat domain-containing protein [Elusimicrobia bacterium]|nr:HEAT repeat domain-containing protein [Elusimicrobiota bacterium]